MSAERPLCFLHGRLSPRAPTELAPMGLTSSSQDLTFMAQLRDATGAQAPLASFWGIGAEVNQREEWHLLNYLRHVLSQLGVFP